MRKDWIFKLKEWIKYNWKYLVHQLLLLGILIVLLIILFDSKRNPLADVEIPDCWS